MSTSSASSVRSESNHGVLSALSGLLGCSESSVAYLQKSVCAHSGILNHHTAELVQSLVDLLSDPSTLHDQLLQGVRARRQVKYEYRAVDASAGLADTIAQFAKTNKPRNAHWALLDRIKTLCFDTKESPLNPTEQFPGFAMWYMMWQNQNKPKFLQAGVLAVMHRLATVYFEEMAQLESDDPVPHSCDKHKRRENGHIMNRCMAHTFLYIGTLPWPPGDVPGIYKQGGCSMFYADWDGFKLNEDKRELPPVGCDIMNGCIRMLKLHGWRCPQVLWMDQRNDCCCHEHCAFFPSNAGTNPDDYKGTTPLSSMFTFCGMGRLSKATQSNSICLVSSSS